MQQLIHSSWQAERTGARGPSEYEAVERPHVTNERLSMNFDKFDERVHRRLQRDGDREDIDFYSLSASHDAVLRSATGIIPRTKVIDLSRFQARRIFSRRLQIQER